MPQKSRQNVLSNLYNQDIAPEDSQITSFFYHKTLALESLIAIFSVFIMSMGLTSYSYRALIAPQTKHKFYNIMIVFSCLGVIAIVLKKLSILKWTKEKKGNYKISKEIIYLLIECLLFAPCPTSFCDSTFQITTYSFQVKEISINSIITFYVLFNKFLYIIGFLIHSELFYGSRPDRLSRLYTVQFGTFNAIKFLINEKPGLVVAATFTFNFFILPFAMLLIQGDINDSLSNFGSCLHYIAVTQVTVGYGDVNVISVFGRVVAIITIMVGVTNTSLLLILFMRLMQLNNQEQQSHFLLESLQKKVNLTKARVVRIQKQWIHSNTRCTKQQFQKKQEQIKAFRYNNRRDIMLERAGTVNIKRMMISNFSEINQSLRNIQQKNSIIRKCIDVIRNAETSFIQKTNKKLQETYLDQMTQKDIKKLQIPSDLQKNSPYDDMALVVRRRQKKQSNFRQKQMGQKKVNLKEELKKDEKIENLSLEKDVQILQNQNSNEIKMRIKNMEFDVQVLCVDLMIQENEQNLPDSKVKSPYLNTQVKFQVNYCNRYEEGPISIQCLNKIYHPNISYDGNVQLPSKEQKPKYVRQVIRYLQKIMKEPGFLQNSIETDIQIQMKDYKLFTKIAQHTNKGLEYQNRQYDKITMDKND